MQQAVPSTLPFITSWPPNGCIPKTTTTRERDREIEKQRSRHPIVIAAGRMAQMVYLCFSKGKPCLTSLASLPPLGSPPLIVHHLNRRRVPSWLGGLLGRFLLVFLRAGLARPWQAPGRPIVPRGRRLLPGRRRCVLRLRRRRGHRPCWEEPGLVPVVSSLGGRSLRGR